MEPTESPDGKTAELQAPAWAPPGPGPPPPPPSPVTRRSRRPLILGGLILVVFLAAAAVGYVILSGEATPSNLRVVDQGFESVAISWEWEEDAAPEGFVVTRNGRRVTDVSGTERGYVDSGLQPATEYRYAVYAELEDGQSEPSAEVVARTGAVPVPQNLEVLDASFESATISWAWTNPVTPDGFVLNRDGAEVARLPGTETVYHDPDLKPGTSYSYTLSAEFGGASSQPTPALTADTLELPPLSEASLSGSHRVVVRYTSESGFESIEVGTRRTGDWSFMPLKRGARLDATLPSGGSWSMRLKGSGRTYRGTTRAQVSSCAGLPVTDTINVTIRVQAADVRFDEWVVTKWTGTLHDESPSATNGIFFCSAGSFTANVQGSARR